MTLYAIRHKETGEWLYETDTQPHRGVFVLDRKYAEDYIKSIVGLSSPFYADKQTITAAINGNLEIVELEVKGE